MLVQLVTTDKRSNTFEGINSSGEHDTLEFSGHGDQSFDRCHQIDASFAVDHRMDFVQNDRFYIAQYAESACRGEHQVQAFWRGDEYFRWMTDHASSLLWFRVAAPCLNPDFGEVRKLFTQL